MPDYSQGKIYCIRSHQTDKIYIGSTCQPLSKRLSDHRTTYKKYKKGKHNYMSSYDILQFEDYYIELLREYPCKCKAKLEKKEGKYIRKFIKKGICVNKRVAGRTRKEYNKQYYENNKDTNKYKDYIKKYYEDNKDKFKQYREDNKDKIKQYDKMRDSIKTVCICGSKYIKRRKARHEQTKKHLKYINSLE